MMTARVQKDICLGADGCAYIAVVTTCDDDDMYRQRNLFGGCLWRW